MTGFTAVSEIRIHHIWKDGTALRTAKSRRRKEEYLFRWSFVLMRWWLGNGVFACCLPLFVVDKMVVLRVLLVGSTIRISATNSLTPLNIKPVTPLVHVKRTKGQIINTSSHNSFPTKVLEDARGLPRVFNPFSPCMLKLKPQTGFCASK